jgi:hypothetical protein
MTISVHNCYTQQTIVYCAKCHFMKVITLNVIFPRVVMLNVTMQSVAIPNVEAPLEYIPSVCYINVALLKSFVQFPESF